MAEPDNPSRVLAEANERAVAAARGGRRKRPRLRWRRLWPRRRSGLTRHGMLPLLIKVFAGFSQVDGQIEEREIDVALGSLRHDFPETVYSELRELYRQALRQTQDLNGIARSLETRLAIEDKILLGVQLYAMVSRSELDRKNLTAFYQFMSNLGVADEAMDIVYQLNTSEPGAIAGPSAPGAPGHHLETLVVSRGPGGDVVLPGLEAGHAIIAFRLGDLILLKNIGSLQVITRGRTVQPNGFVRLFDGQQVVLGEMVLDYRDLSFYFNAKKQVASVRLYLSFDSEGNAYVEKQQSRQTFLEVWFGLSVTITAFRETPGSINSLRLTEGATLEASLRDRIEFDDRTEIALLDLWRRAKVLGGRFDLNPARSEYMVSNNPSDLQEGISSFPEARADSCFCASGATTTTGRENWKSSATTGPSLSARPGERSHPPAGRGRHHDRGWPVPALSFHRRDHRGGAQPGQPAPGAGSVPPVWRRCRSGRGQLHGGARGDGLHHGAEREREEHPAAVVGRAPQAVPRTDPPQRSEHVWVGLEPATARSLCFLHSA